MRLRPVSVEATKTTNSRYGTGKNGITLPIMLVRRPNLDYKIVHKIIHDTSRCFHSPVARGSSRLCRAAVESGLLSLLQSDGKDPSQPELYFRSGNLHTPGLLTPPNG